MIVSDHKEPDARHQHRRSSFADHRLLSKNQWSLVFPILFTAHLFVDPAFAAEASPTA
jgi:hypothetical protein